MKNSEFQEVQKAWLMNHSRIKYISFYYPTVRIRDTALTRNSLREVVPDLVLYLDMYSFNSNFHLFLDLNVLGLKTAQFPRRNPERAGSTHPTHASPPFP